MPFFCTHVLFHMIYQDFVTWKDIFFLIFEEKSSFKEIERLIEILTSFFQFSDS